MNVCLNYISHLIQPSFCFLSTQFESFVNNRWRFYIMKKAPCKMFRTTRVWHNAIEQICHFLLSDFIVSSINTEIYSVCSPSACFLKNQQSKKRKEKKYNQHQRMINIKIQSTFVCLHHFPTYTYILCYLSFINCNANDTKCSQY